MPVAKGGKMTLDEGHFETLAEEVLQRFSMALEAASDDIDVELQASVLTVELEDGRTFVLNKHGPMRQIWLSSPLSGASHYGYDEAKKCWLSSRDSRELVSTLTDDFAQAGIRVTLA
ncbi:MAG: iron donor protein CyaY [Proteobacteria bacterium]|nr:iron donor protein CyaY [Pseudomonadota bacterium]